MKAPKKKILDEINITPLTDIFLVLLIIMMVVAPLLNWRGLPISFVSAQASSKTDKEFETLTITVSANGQCMVEGQATPVEVLRDTVLRESATRPDGVVVEVDPDADLQSMVAVLDAVRAANVTQVYIAEGAKSGGTEPSDTPPAADGAKDSAAKPAEKAAARPAEKPSEKPAAKKAK